MIICTENPGNKVNKVKNALNVQVSASTNTTKAWLRNPNCKNQASPEYCPEKWEYIDENGEMQNDSVLSITCGKVYLE